MEDEEEEEEEEEEGKSTKKKKDITINFTRELCKYGLTQFYFVYAAFPWSDIWEVLSYSPFVMLHCLCARITIHMCTLWWCSLLRDVIWCQPDQVNEHGDKLKFNIFSAFEDMFANISKQIHPLFNRFQFLYPWRMLVDRSYYTIKPTRDVNKKYLLFMKVWGAIYYYFQSLLIKDLTKWTFHDNNLSEILQDIQLMLTTLKFFQIDACFSPWWILSPIFFTITSIQRSQNQSHYIYQMCPVQFCVVCMLLKIQIHSGFHW